jgi:hypothetical protein
MHDTTFFFNKLNEHLIANFGEYIYFNNSFKFLKKTKFTLTYSKDYSSFLSIKFRAVKFKSTLQNGFLVGMSDLTQTGLIAYEQLPFYNEMEEIHTKLHVYSTATTGRLWLAKVFVYFPVDNGPLRYLLMYDTGENLMFISDIPELLTDSPEFLSNKIKENFYIFTHVQNNFEETVKNCFFRIYQDLMREPVTQDDFLVAIMAVI